MYIPINFLASSLSCANVQISGSTLSNNSKENYGILNSGSSDAQFWIITRPGESVTFDIVGGITSQAKLLLVGGGGLSSVGSGQQGGGGAGQVIFKDISLQPGTLYFMSSSAYGGTSASSTGGTSTFIENYIEGDAENWSTTIASGGFDNTGTTGGNSRDGFSGGTGTSNAGGGGGGSTGNGQNGIGNDGGDGGDGFTIPTTYREDKLIPAGTKIAGGGPGSGTSTDGSYTSGLDPNAVGNGGDGSLNPSDANGKDGIAMLFIPINTCELTPTGSIVLDEQTPNAIGGDIVGTFTSASRDYKYHLFTTGSKFINFNQGSTTEGKILLVAGGGYGGQSPYVGGGGAGGVAIKRNQTLYGTFQVTAGEAGTSSDTKGFDSVLSSTSNYIYKVRAVGGGRGASSSVNGQDGGSGGGGYDTTRSPGSSINCNNNSFCTADEYFGNDGGNGGRNGSIYGGGGGGAGSVGETGGPTTGAGGSGYTLTTEFFPPTDLFTSSSIARGGNRDNLSVGYTTENNSGDGGSDGQPARKGFVCITYPIS